MPATAADIKFFASATMTDTSDGGGPRASTVVQNGVLSNVFPSLGGSDRDTGRVFLRKIYPSMTNADTAPLLGAALVLNEVPSDPAVDVWMFKSGGPLTTRAQAVAALEAGALIPTGQGVGLSASWAGGSTTLSLSPFTSTDPLNENTVVGSRGAVFFAGRVYRFRVTARASSGPPESAFVRYDLTVASALPGSGGCFGIVFIGNPGVVRVYGAATVPGSLTAGGTAVALSSVYADVAPVPATGPYPTLNNGISPDAFRGGAGGVPIVAPEDVITLWHEATTSPATAVNGTPISTGRTNLDQLAIVGANGLEIVRFLAGGPTPNPAVATVNLAAGTVTPTSVTGWSQPVTVRHRIAHRSAVSAISGETVNLATALTRDFPAGSVLSSHMPLGDLRARSLNAFSQQAWTRVWSDTLIGNPTATMYSGLPATTNQGAETDRYAVVFTSATAFDVFSERLGLLGSGVKSANFSPLSPATGAPLFTLASANWAASIPVGSTFRFNTEAASASAWIGRTVAPSTAGGTVTANVRLVGSVD